MKPNFALHFTDTSIALLHRTAKGWLKIGDTPFDAPDLDEALDYLRKTALGLEPAGFTTKLVIPNDQILFAEIEAPGPDESVRRGQIAAAIEERTPYRAEEVVFDWSGRGRNVKVAAVARETLAEAEGFAVTHRFNPVGFVAIPAEGQFSGEPWFGNTAVAETLIAPGETVERDKQAIALIADGARRARRQNAAEAGPSGAEAPAPATPAAAESVAVPAATPAPEDRAALPEPPAEAPPEAPAEAPAEAVAAEAPVAAPDQGEMRFDPPKPPPAVAEPAPEPEPEPAPEVAREPAPAPEAAPESVPEPQPAKGPSLSISGVHATRSTPAAPPRAEAPPAEPEPPVTAPEPAEMRAEIGADDTAGDVAEAPFAHIGDAEEDDLNLRRRPIPRPGERLAERLAADTRAEQRKAAIPPALQADEGEDDLPPLPSSAILAARAKSAGMAAPAAARPATAAPAASRTAPPVSAPRVEARTAPRIEPRADARSEPQLSGATSALARGKQIEELPPLPEKPPLASPKARTAKPAAAAATAPALPAGRRNKAKASPADDRVAPPPADAARSLGRSPFAARAAQRGKPRHLGLILVAILLLCLALVAAWSSIYLASGRDNDSSYAVVDPGAGTGDEAAADGPDPEALADGYSGEEDEGGAALATAPPADDTEALAAVAEDPAPDPAPDAAVNSASPAPVALADTQDEIFLSAADAPPPAFDAAALPSPEAQAEAPPETPMPPPPFGTVYQFDDQGLIVPQASGIPSPDGYMLYAGKPSRVPPPRSATAEAAAEAARQVEAAPLGGAAPSDAPAAPPVTAPATPPANALPGNDSSGALGGAAQPAAVTAAAASAAGNPSLVAAMPLVDTAANGAAADPALQPAAQPHPELAGQRPRNRPETAETSETAAAAPADAEVAPAGTDTPQFTGPRPRERSAAVTAAAAAASETETLQASAAAADAGNPSILKISRRPEARPRDFSRAVEAAVAAAVRTPEPAAPEPEQVAAAPAPVAAAPTASAAPPSPPTGKRSSRAEGKGTTIKPEEEDEINEPELASNPAPKIPTKASVAKNATFAKAINLSKINLIGVYGSQSNRYALIRQTNGKYKKVKVGDRIDGGQIQAITQTEVRYQKGGRLIALAMPKG